MAAAGAKSDADDGAEREMRVSITAPLSPAKPAFVQLVGTLNTLWGSDRVLRTAQFVGRLVGGSPELGSEANALGFTFGAAFSQARYINRLYGILDSTEGLIYDVPKGPAHVRILKILLHGVGGVGYHVLEHIALILMIIRRCDPAKIPRVKAWLEQRGLWDKADDFDAIAQWCWFVEAAIKLYFLIGTRRKIQAALKKAVATGDNGNVAKLLNWRTMCECDMVKNGTDCILAPHFGVMVGNRPGLLSTRYVGLLGMAGSMAQFVVRYRQQACKHYSLDMGLQM